MSLPPALLQRLAQRGLVQKQNQESKNEDSLNHLNVTENEEVIAEDYDEMESEEQDSEEYPSQYDYEDTNPRKRADDNFWRQRMKARMGETTSFAGYKGCPNKYNIYHKCTLYCVNRWADGQPEPKPEYKRRYKRLLKKYPLPKGWVEIYDPGCACYYFYSSEENLVSWLPPTHPKSQVSKSAAVLRRQLEETGEGAEADSGSEPQTDDEGDYDGERSDEEPVNRRDIDDSKSRLPLDVPTVRDMNQRTQEDIDGNSNNRRKQRSRDLDRVLSRHQRDRERERDRSGVAGRHVRGGGGDNDTHAIDPMDPSSYSDTPRGKWSDGLEKSQRSGASDSSRNRGNNNSKRRHDDDYD